MPGMLALSGDTYVRAYDAKGGSVIPESDFIPRGGDILRAEGQAAFLKSRLGIDPGPVFRPTFKIIALKVFEGPGAVFCSERL